MKLSVPLVGDVCLSIVIKFCLRFGGEFSNDPHLTNSGEKLSDMGEIEGDLDSPTRFTSSLHDQQKPHVDGMGDGLDRLPSALYP